METSTPSTSGSRARTTAMLLVGVAFVAGALIGFAGGRIYSFRHPGLPQRGAEFVSQRVMRHLDSELNLTAPQHAQVQQILDRHHKRMEEITSSFHPQIRQELDAATHEIEAVLTPEQRKKFADMHMRMDRMRRRRGGESQPPAPHGF